MLGQGTRVSIGVLYILHGLLVGRRRSVIFEKKGFEDFFYLVNFDRSLSRGLEKVMPLFWRSQSG